ncbi:amidohydrolase family protein [uncultured Tateyamaria sp.]|uniref:amidohydrolase family protein n=1 Tax=uncultured Tateyamaria sp. TaxID=455651 RepID=UPI00262B876B|nr:amidohydrolase family protein [uncultured Tateyamaria sp.]
MIIDAHQHFWTLARGDYPWPNLSVSPIFQDFGPQDLEPLLKLSGVDRTVLVQATATVPETEFLLDLANYTDFVAAVVGWVPLDHEDAKLTIDRLAQHPKFRGVRPMLQDISNTAWILQPNVLDALRHVASCDLSMDALIQPRHLPAIHQLLLEVPDLRLVVDHVAKPEMISGKPDTWWKDGMSKLAAHRNCYCKLSGMVTEIGSNWTEDQLAPFLSYVIEAFGTDRILWGSDWPVLNLASDYQAWSSVFDQLLEPHAAVISKRSCSDTTAAFYRIESRANAT